MAKHGWADIRRRIAKRAGARCEHCKSPAKFCPDPLSVEHIILRNKRGSASLSNLALACQGCNNHKYTRLSAPDPITGRRVALFHPRKHRWSDHFAWSPDGVLIIGLTPVGRATVEALQLNRTGLVGLREALVAFGAHPPKE